MGLAHEQLSVPGHVLLTQQGSLLLAEGSSKPDLCICCVDRQEIPFCCLIIPKQLKPGYKVKCKSA